MNLIIIIKLVMSTDNCQDIFYQVKKEILDKLDIILQKVNLQIINSRHFRSIEAETDFTFIQLSHFQSEISSLFVYLDKLYDSLNSSVSGYTTQGHQSIQQIQIINEKLESEIKLLKKQKDGINIQLIRISGQLSKNNEKLQQYRMKNRKVRQNLKDILNQLHHEPKQFNIVKKWLNGKLKQFKFEMLQTRVEILSRVKQYESQIKQVELSRNMEEVACHQLSHDEMQIINELNEILKMC